MHANGAWLSKLSEWKLKYLSYEDREFIKKGWGNEEGEKREDWENKRKRQKGQFEEEGA